MIRIYIFADSYKHFDKSIEEYKNRLSKSVEIIKLKPVKKGTDKEIINSETSLLMNKLLKEKAFKIVLNPNGKSFNTKEFYDFLELKKQNYSRLVFCIGGANGLDYNIIKNNIDFELNLGSMTMPHSLALLVLLEQIYRSEMIKKGTNYDK